MKTNTAASGSLDQVGDLLSQHSAFEVVLGRTGNTHYAFCDHVRAGSVRIGDAYLEVDAELGRFTDLFGPALVVFISFVVGYKQYHRGSSVP